MFECENGVVVQIMTPPVPMWAEYKDDAASAKTPVVCLALVQKADDPDNPDVSPLPNAEIIPLIALHGSKHPFAPASDVEGFLGFSFTQN